MGGNVKMVFALIISIVVGGIFGFGFAPVLLNFVINMLGETGVNLSYQMTVTHPGSIILFKMTATLIGTAITFFIISGFMDKDKKPKETEKIDEIDNYNVLKALMSNTGFLISKHFRLTRDFFKEHILYMGPTGAGKTTSGFIPNLLDSDAVNCSVVVNDIKLDIITATANRRKALGSDVKLFAPFKPEYSVRINPLLQVKDSSEVRQLAATIMINGPSGNTSNSDWIDMGKPLLSSVFLAAIATDPNPTISKCIRAIMSMDDDSLAKYINNSGSSEAIDTYSLYKQSAKAPGTAAGIRTVLGGCTQLFLDNKIEFLLSGNELDLRDLRRKKVSFYIHVPETKIDYAKPLTALIYYLLFSVVSSEDGDIVPMMLDEFANIGHIPNFQNTISVCRGRGIPLILGIQSSSQLEEIYGVSAAGVILDNLKTKIFFPGMGPNSAEYASKIIGRKAYKQKLLDESYIREIPENKVIVVSRNKPPVIDDSCYYKNNKEMVRLASDIFDINELYRGPIDMKSSELVKTSPTAESIITETEQPKHADKLDIFQKSNDSAKDKSGSNGFDF